MKVLKHGAMYAFLVIASIISIFPIYYALCLASGGNVDLQVGPMLPGLKLLENISYILFETKFKEPFLYTLGYCLMQTILTMCVCVLAGYGFEIYHDKRKDSFFNVILWVYMIPFASLVVPTFIIFSDVSMVNTTAAIILPFIASPLIIMIFRQQSRDFPKEVMEAARLDGVREPFLFLYIYLPNMKSTLACGIVISFLNAWNSYQWPRIIMTHETKIPMMVYLTHMGHGDNMTLVLMSMFPSMIVFFFFQKYFVQGMGCTVER